MVSFFVPQALVDKPFHFTSRIYPNLGKKVASPSAQQLRLSEVRLAELLASTAL